MLIMKGKTKKEKAEVILKLLSNDNGVNNGPTPGVVLSYRHPLTDDQRGVLYEEIWQRPHMFHLIDCLKHLKPGRPEGNQVFLDWCIAMLNDHLEEGEPFV